jgi:hypothetical protein
MFANGTVHVMRHLGSLLAGLVIGPIAWLLIALGAPRSQEIFARWATEDTVNPRDLLVPAALFAGAGILIGLVGMLRWSPLGPLVAGAMYLGAYVALFFLPSQRLTALPRWRVAGAVIDPVAPLASGALPVLGVALVMAVFSVKRWRRWPAVSAPPPAPAPIGRPDMPLDSADTFALPGGGEPVGVGGPVIPAPRHSPADDGPPQYTWPYAGPVTAPNSHSQPVFHSESSPEPETREQPGDGAPTQEYGAPTRESRPDRVPASADDPTVPIIQPTPTTQPAPEPGPPENPPAPRTREEPQRPAGNPPTSPWSAPPRSPQE